MREKRQFSAEMQSIEELTEFVSGKLEEYGIERKNRIKAVLVVEEAAGSLISHKKEGDNGGEISAG